MTKIEDTTTKLYDNNFNKANKRANLVVYIASMVFGFLMIALLVFSLKTCAKRANERIAQREQSIANHAVIDSVYLLKPNVFDNNPFNADSIRLLDTANAYVQYVTRTLERVDQIVFEKIKESSKRTMHIERFYNRTKFRQNE